MIDEKRIIFDRERQQTDEVSDCVESLSWSEKLAFPAPPLLARRGTMRLERDLVSALVGVSDNDRGKRPGASPSMCGDACDVLELPCDRSGCELSPSMSITELDGEAFDDKGADATIRIGSLREFGVLLVDGAEGNPDRLVLMFDISPRLVMAAL